MKQVVKIFGLFIVISLFSFKVYFTNQINPKDYDEVLKSGLAAIDFSAPSHEMKGEINLCCGVLDPVTGECQVNGKVKYAHYTLRKGDGKAMIRVNLELDAELCNRHGSEPSGCAYQRNRWSKWAGSTYPEIKNRWFLLWRKSF